jgi:ribose transport system substrate-binding protein
MFMTYRLRICLSIGALIGASLLIAACGDSDSSETSGSSNGSAVRDVSLQAPKSGCGSYSKSAVQDPDGVVAGLPADIKDNYSGYPFTVRKSAWSNWKPKGKPPYKVGVQWAQISNDFNVKISNAVRKRLASNPDIGEVKFQSTGSNLDVGQQLQQFQALIRSKPDILILEEIQPEAFRAAIEQAGKAGIPTIIAIDSVDSPYAVNVNSNLFNDPAQTASVAVRKMGGKGNLLKVRTIPGVGVETYAAKAVDAVLKSCPDIKTLGEVYGNFVNSTAKSETLKFLATHPQKIDGAIQNSGMGAGVIGAFKQTGRPVPIMGDIGASKASLAYWAKNTGTYDAAVSVAPTLSFGNAMADVAGRMLRGDGLKMTDIVWNMAQVTPAEKGKWVDPSWTFETPGDAAGPADQLFPGNQLDSFFNSSNAGN